MMRVLLTMILLMLDYPLALTEEGLNYAPAWSPDGKQIAYIHDPGYESEIFVANADGSGVTQVTFLPGWHAQPVWSPDGTHIAFLGGASLDFDLFVMRAGGSDVINLTNARMDIDHLTWSSDSSRIAFDAQGQVWVAAADGSGVSQLTSEPETSWSPSWSPDGTRIAFHRSEQIWVMNADGSNAVQLTPGAWGGCCPAWSPDGTRIAYLQPLEDRPNVGLVVMSSDGSSQQALVSGIVLGPAWSPHSDRLAYILREPYQLVGGDVWVVDADGGAPTKLTNESEDGLFRQPVRWSGDGLSLLCEGNDTMQADVFRLRASGSEVVNLTNSRYADFDPVWSPAAHQIAFVSTRSARTELWVTNPRGLDPQRILAGESLHGLTWSPDSGRILLTTSVDETARIVTVGRDGSDVQTLTPDDERASDPDWSPDGSRIVYARQNEIWTMDAAGGNPVQLADGDSLKTDPLWSPDGKYILYRGGSFSALFDSLWIMDADGSDPQQLVDRAADRRLPAGAHWSPNSGAVAYAGSCYVAPGAEASATYGPPLNRSICQVNVDGSGLTELAPYSEDNRDPVYSPDGSRIAYAASGDTGEGGVYVLDLDTRALSRIAESGERPVWSPDGTLIAVGGGDIWIVQAQ